MKTEEYQENKDELCEACGSFAEIGSLIKEGEEILNLALTNVTEAEMQAQIDSLVSDATARFGDSFKYTVVPTPAEEGVAATLSMEFSCTAERLIFEMNMRHLFS